MNQFRYIISLQLMHPGVLLLHVRSVQVLQYLESKLRLGKYPCPLLLGLQQLLVLFDGVINGFLELSILFPHLEHV